MSNVMTNIRLGTTGLAESVNIGEFGELSARKQLRDSLQCEVSWTGQG